MPAIVNATAAVVLPTLAAITATASPAATAATTLTSSLQAILSVVNASAAIALSPLQRRLQQPAMQHNDAGDDVAVADGGDVPLPSSSQPSHANVASIILSNFLPTSFNASSSSTATTPTTGNYNSPSTSTTTTIVLNDDNSIDRYHHQQQQQQQQHHHHLLQLQLQQEHEANHENLVSAPSFPTFSPPSIESLVASSAEDLSNFRDVTFDIFDDDDELFGSPLAFDASENGLWNGRFVPPPPRPPFFVDEPVLSDGLTTCDLCSWAMPTKSTFIFEGTIEKASELGWPLTLIIVSILSALVGAIVMITVVRCRRKKASNNRNETHVQWWSRNKRPNGSNSSASSNNNNNHLRRSNIYTAHPADSIRGGCSMMGQPSLSAASSLTAMTAMGVSAAIPSPAVANVGQPPNGVSPVSAQHQHLQQQQQQPQQQQQSQPPPQYYHTYGHHQAHGPPTQPHPHYHHTAAAHHHNHHNGHGSHASHSHSHHQLQHEYEYEHEYHQPQELHAAAAAAAAAHQHHHLQHQRTHSASLSSETSSPTLSGIGAINSTAMLPVQMHAPQRRGNNNNNITGSGSGVGGDDTCRWSNSTLMVAS